MRSSLPNRTLHARKLASANRSKRSVSGTARLGPDKLRMPSPPRRWSMSKCAASASLRKTKPAPTNDARRQARVEQRQSAALTPTRPITSACGTASKPASGCLERQLVSALDRLDTGADRCLLRG